MSDNVKEIASLADLFKATWFWAIPLAGGVADYLVQAQRGLKPRSPVRVVIAAILVHSFVAVIAGMLLAMAVGAAGYRGELAFGAAGGIGGFMGVRVFDIAVLFARLRAGSQEGA